MEARVQSAIPRDLGSLPFEENKSGLPSKATARFTKRASSCAGAMCSWNPIRGSKTF